LLLVALAAGGGLVAGILLGHFAWDQVGMALHFIGDHVVVELPVR
jgi:hypothetical protein